MSPRRGGATEFDLDSSTPYTFVLVDGAFNASCFGPLAETLIRAGHRVINPILPTHDLQATFEDDTEAVQQAIQGARNMVPIMHSRGVETARLFASEDLERFVGSLLVSSGGPHFYQIDPELPEANENRYTQEYRSAIVQLPGGFTELNRIGSALIYNDVTDLSLLREALLGLRPHRDSSKDNSPPFVLPTLDIPIQVVLGKKERVLNMNRAVCAWKTWVGLSPQLFDSGHTPQLARVERFAQYCINFANQARKGRLEPL